jgi:flavin reductase (DIM6/NTAB) family NADH-FMN oxidoreductase RutF
VALSKIIETGKVVVSEISFEHKDIIYQLGKHHSSIPPSLELLPFKVTTSENFGFYIPDWAESYKEIKIERTINLGSHMLLWGEVINQVTLKTHTSHLFHIHFLLYLHQKRKGFSYQLV